MINVTENINEGSGNIKKIIKGSLIAILFTIACLIIFATLLTYTNLSEKTIKPVIIVITIVSVLIGSSISMYKLKKNGIINGAIVGLVYILFIYLLSSIIEKDFSLNIYSIIMIIGSVIAGAVGGIIGVNK